MAFLRRYRGALLVISHDLELLDEAITRVLHLDEGDASSSTYKGTVLAVPRGREPRRSAGSAKIAARPGSRDRPAVRRSPTRMRHQTETTRPQGQALDPRVEKLQASAQRPSASASARSRSASPTRRRPAASCSRSTAWPRLRRPAGVRGRHVRLGRGERLLVLGLNGAGKTSLLRILAGETDADRATVALGHGVSLGYYAQEHEGIDPAGDVAARPHARASPRLPDDRSSAALLGMFGLSGEKAFQDAGTLSGGEKTKLALAQLVAGRHNLLLLDEPTNNLDRRRARRSARRWRRGRARWCSSATTPSSSSARARPGAADARRRPRLLERRPPRPGRPGLAAAFLVLVACGQAAGPAQGLAEQELDLGVDAAQVVGRPARERVVHAPGRGAAGRPCGPPWAALRW